MTGKKGAVHYTEAIKLEAVRMFLEEGKTRAEIAQDLRLRNAKQVGTWVSQSRHEENEFKKVKGRPRKQVEQVESLEE